MPELYPLQFEPILQPYVWGGMRLATLLGKLLSGHATCAESWEVVDHADGVSRVTNGPLAGTTLHQLVTSRGADLLGRHHPQPRFPLLLKFLDAQLTLSVQVHPNDAQGAQLTPPDLGKTETWVVLAADPGSKIYAGLRPGVTPELLKASIQNGNCPDLLHQFEPRPGDCLLIEAGTIHALGAGIVIAEIQQASNTTFRLYDWDRRDAQGNARPLHIEQALATIDFTRGPVAPVTPVAMGPAGRERLVSCDKFLLDRWNLAAEVTLPTDDRFHLLASIEGATQLISPHGTLELPIGQSCLVPAKRQALTLRGNPAGVLLDAYLP